MKKIGLKTLKTALRVLARWTLWRHKPTVIGITGNVGKTSTKQAVEAVLSHDKKVRAAPKSFNNEIGLPLAILGKWRDTGGALFWLRVVAFSILQVIFKNPFYPEVVVLEYGVDRPGDMDRLLSIARPSIAVVTAVGEIPVHVEFFTGREAVIREKTKLVAQLPATGFAVLNRDDESVYDMKDKTRAQIMTFGFSEDADVRISSFGMIDDGDTLDLNFKLNYSGGFTPVRIHNVIGRAQCFASAASACVGLVCDINLVKVSEGLDYYVSPRGRMKVLKGIKKSLIVDDTYNASPLSTKSALEAIDEIDAKRKVAVLGDMLEIGKYTMEAHQSVGDMAAGIVDLLITVGTRGKLIADGALEAGMSKKKIEHFTSTAEAGKFLQKKMKTGDLILVKGSQGVRMERIVKEVMAEPDKAEELLVRQSSGWLEKKGMYE